MSVLVLGLGNLLMTDDALGSLTIAQLLRDYRFPEQVELVDGGTLGLDLLPRFEGVSNLLVIDALQMGEAPGTVFRLEGEEVPRAFANKLSVHQMGLQDLLAVSELQGQLPERLVVWGAQAKSIEMGLSLSPEVQTAMAEVIDGILDELKQWGVLVEQVA
ncbi:MAG: hydrogenase maturation protease [Deltaproteobacteria bacterium]|nr:hydrogenase maturation protease [Deltaproteobacteria bacterium]